MRVNAAGSMLRGGRTASGVLVQVEGRGTLIESPALHEFAVQLLEDPRGASTLVVDLSHCDYLDSTFLGCLVDLHRKYHRTAPHRFLVAAPYETRQKLLHPSHIDQVLDVTDLAPEPIGETLELTGPTLTHVDMGRHIMECHRRLAELGGSQAASFQSVADELARDLGEAPVPCDTATGELQNPSP